MQWLWYWKWDKHTHCFLCARYAIERKKSDVWVCASFRNGKDQREYVNFMSEKKRKTNDDTLRLSHINRYSNCFSYFSLFRTHTYTSNENVAFNLAWTALTLKPHKSTCDISTCVLEYSVWSWCDTCLPLFIYLCSVAFWTRPNLLTLLLVLLLFPWLCSFRPILSAKQWSRCIHIAIRMIWSNKNWIKCLNWKVATLWSTAFNFNRLYFMPHKHHSFPTFGRRFLLFHISFILLKFS